MSESAMVVGNWILALVNIVLAVVTYRRGMKTNALVCSAVAVFCLIAGFGKW